MAYKSWLEKAKRIEDLGPHCHNLHGSESEEDWARAEAKDLKFMEVTRQPIPVAEEFKPYFGSKLHDSWLLGIERDRDKLTVSVDSIAGMIFRQEMAALLGIEEPDIPFQVNMVCHGVKYFASRGVTPDGSLTWKDWKNIQKQDSFRWDWFYEQEDRLQWLAELWMWRSEKMSMDQFLLVDCSHVSALDLTRQGAIKAFGEEYAPLWESVVERINDATMDSILYLDGMNAFLVERAEARGMPFDLPTG